MTLATNPNHPLSHSNRLLNSHSTSTPNRTVSASSPPETAIVATTTTTSSTRLAAVVHPPSDSVSVDNNLPFSTRPAQAPPVANTASAPAASTASAPASASASAPTLTLAPATATANATTVNATNTQHQTSRKRPASLMMDLDKPTRASANPSSRRSHPDDIDMTHPPHHLQHQTHLHTPHEDEMSTAQRLFDVTLDSPSSPSAYKRMRSSADSDAGSSSCKDMDDPDVLAPDSVPALLHQIRKLLDYVASKPTLQNGSASFVRDYLRTMLIQNSIAAEEAIQTAAKYHKADVAAGTKKPNQCFKIIPDDLAKHIFSFLDGHNLARAREVCRRWNDFACEEPLWKELCLKKWRSLETDKELWKLIDKNVDPNGPNRWRQIFPKVNRSLQWNCRLQKTGRFICNLVAHHISGAPLGEAGIPSILVVERRFNILHLQTFVRPDASILYFEPEAESDRSGFVDFIEYLNKRTRAGLALDGQLRFIFIPPCEYTRTQVEYQGESLLGVVQNAYPHVPE